MAPIARIVARISSQPSHRPSISSQPDTGTRHWHRTLAPDTRPDARTRHSHPTLAPGARRQSSRQTMNDKRDDWHATPKPSQEPPGPRQTKVAKASEKASEFALAAIEIYFKVYLKAVLERRRSAVALHKQLRLLHPNNDLMQFVGRYEHYYNRGFGMCIGESFQEFRVRDFTTVIGKVSEKLLLSASDHFPTFSPNLPDHVIHIDLWAKSKHEKERTERLRKGGYWSRYECLWPERRGLIWSTRNHVWTI